jgi:hypothetical protein
MASSIIDGPCSRAAKQHLLDAIASLSVAKDVPDHEVNTHIVDAGREIMRALNYFDEVE